VLVDTGTGNAILGNSIFANAGAGIILANGGNDNTSAPVLAQATQSRPNNLRVSGTISSGASANSYNIQIFSNVSGSKTPGQGDTVLGSITVTTQLQPDGSYAATFVFARTITAVAGTTITATATDSANNTSKFSAPVSVVHVGIIAVGSDAGPANGPPSAVNVYDATTGKLKFSINPYGAWVGGVRVAVGDLNGDGVPDVVTAPGPGGSPEIHVYDGQTGQSIAPTGTLFPFGQNFLGGVYVAVGDLNGDGKNEIICGAGAGGGPGVQVYGFTPAAPGSGNPNTASFSLRQSFFAFNPAFTGGVRVAAGDANGNGMDDIICGAGPGGGPDVSVFDGVTDGLLRSFFAFDPAFTGGVYVAAANLAGGGPNIVIVGAGAGAGPAVYSFNEANGEFLGGFLAYSPFFAGGVRVAAYQSFGSGRDFVLTGAGPGGGPQVTAYDSVPPLTVVDSFFAFDPTFSGGVFVAGA
jgi:hypothetical protein